ncbi:hypothetical protein M2137_001205 [Parabacteroides sp. PFB2-10]|nr:hypothetical protein [Parabacteroides sp. PFB2-10]
MWRWIVQPFRLHIFVGRCFSIGINALNSIICVPQVRDL